LQANTIADKQFFKIRQPAYLPILHKYGHFFYANVPDAQGFRDKPDFPFTIELTNLAVQTNR